MLGSFRSNVTAGIAVLVGIAGLTYVLAVKGAPPERQNNTTTSAIWATINPIGAASNNHRYNSSLNIDACLNVTLELATRRTDSFGIVADEFDVEHGSK